eukprot:1870279-Alexandrium_andersonii.AAC.1
MSASLVGSEMCIRDRPRTARRCWALSSRCCWQAKTQPNNASMRRNCPTQPSAYLGSCCTA